jgi:hypothetical protein
VIVIGGLGVAASPLELHGLTMESGMSVRLYATVQRVQR